MQLKLETDYRNDDPRTSLQLDCQQFYLTRAEAEMLAKAFLDILADEDYTLEFCNHSLTKQNIEKNIFSVHCLHCNKLLSTEKLTDLELKEHLAMNELLLKTEQRFIADFGGKERN